jgi:long-chain acyl-CoA synthetase
MIVKANFEDHLVNPYFDINQINTDSFQELIASIEDIHGDKRALSYFEGNWVEGNYQEFVSNVLRFSRFLTKKNISSKNILILSESRPEVVELYFAGFCSNVTTVPVDVKLSAKEIAYILQQTKPEIVFVSSKHFSDLKQAQLLCEFPITMIAINKIQNSYSLEDIVDDESIKLPDEDIDKTGMIIYTSGSTGQMKGVETRGSQLLFQIKSLMRVGNNEQKERLISMLPLNHLFEVSGLFAALASGHDICIAHSLEKEDLGVCFQKQQPTLMFTVPLFCKSIMNGVKLNIADSPLPKRFIFKLITLLAKLIPVTKFRRFLFSAIHQKFGGNLYRFIAGGAAVDKSIIRFFSLIGISIFEGYGLTETSPVITVNRKESWAPGSVGQLIPGVEVKIDDTNGEIYTRGPHIMKGYFNNPNATKEVIDKEGWFRTGDIGSFDDKNNLFITGRSKNLIILESGKKVHPEEVEKVFDDIDFIKEISIFGDKSKSTSNSQNIVLVAHIDDNTLQENGLEKSQELLQNEIFKRSDRIASYKMPSKICISRDELPKTTTMKVKHFKVAQKYFAGEIN